MKDRNDFKPNYLLMIGMSIACVLCYYFLFKKIPFQSWSIFKLALISIATCYTIMILGNMIAFMIAAYFLKAVERKNGIIFDFLVNFITSFVTSTIGSILFSHIAILMGLVNVFWLICFR